jgi:hypothetical protein|eukprot:COSAG01_NODE_1856_length_9043_cov_87.168679_3_plen_83_part_00
MQQLMILHGARWATSGYLRARHPRPARLRSAAAAAAAAEGSPAQAGVKLWCWRLTWADQQTQLIMVSGADVAAAVAEAAAGR